MEHFYSASRFLYDATPELPTLLLFVLLALAWYLMRAAERAEGYWSTLFMDENGKASTMRVCAIWAFAVSSAILLYITINYVKTSDGLKGLEIFYIAFLLTWSASPLLAKLLEVLAARWLK